MDKHMIQYKSEYIAKVLMVKRTTVPGNNDGLFVLKNDKFIIKSKQ